MAKKAKSPKEPKILKPSMLREFAKQYRYKMISGYLYIECPIICTAYLTAVNWAPKHEFISDMNIELDKIGRTITMGCVYSKHDQCYFVVGHLWMPMVYVWAPADMKLYLEKIHRVMLTNAYRKDADNITVTPAPVYEEKQKYIAEDKEVSTKKSLFLERIKNDVSKESFFEKYSISIDTYTAMCNDKKIIVETFEESTHVLDFHKFLFNKYQVLLRDTMTVLVEKGIFIQDKNDANYKNNYFISKEFISCGFGFNEFNALKNTTYPVLYLKGVFTILLILHDAGILSKQIIPKLF